MGQIVVNVGSFDLTSHNGNTAYSSVRYFDIPANAGITGCVATFAQHVNTGSFQGKSFSLNGAQAHPNTTWPTSGISLNAALLSTGQNTFRAAVKSQAGLSARWAIGDIYLTITYNDVGGGGGGGGTTDPGSISISTPSLTAGDSLTVSITGASGGVYRDVYIQKMPSTANILSVVQGHGSGTGSWTITIPESWCETLSPNDPSFEVRIYMVAYITGGTVVGDGARMLTVNVPLTAVPTMDDFTVALNSNGVDASITGYVQNYSKSNLEIVGASGVLGSTISSYEIVGGGWSANTGTATFGPFSQTGDIVFTAKVTDTRGRTAVATVSITVMPYTPVSAVNISAIRSDASGTTQDEGVYASLRGKRVFSLLGGENSAIIKGRVFERNTSPHGWTNMIDDTLTLFGSLSIEKAYTAQISIEDKITSVIYVIEIPTSIVGIHILPGATGGGFGMYGRDGCWDFSAPLFSPEGACPGIGDILVTLNSASPAVRFPDTTWSAIEGVFLLGADSTYIAGSTGGETVHVLTESEMPIHHHAIWSLNWDVATGPSGGATATAYGAKGDVSGNAGSGNAHNNMPPYLSVYLWERTA